MLVNHIARDGVVEALGEGSLHSHGDCSILDRNVHVREAEAGHVLVVQNQDDTLAHSEDFLYDDEGDGTSAGVMLLDALALLGVSPLEVHKEVVLVATSWFAVVAYVVNTLLAQKNDCRIRTELHV
jgi:hypothetical protein